MQYTRYYENLKKSVQDFAYRRPFDISTYWRLSEDLPKSFKKSVKQYLAYYSISPSLFLIYEIRRLHILDLKRAIKSIRILSRPEI